MKKNIYLDFGLEYDLLTRLKKIKRAGFDGVFLWFYDDLDYLNRAVKITKECNLDIETFHLPFANCNYLWVEGQNGEDYMNSIIKGVKVASHHHVKTVIMHTVSSLNHPLYTPLGLQRVRKILQVCNEYNVDLAIENVRDLSYSDYIFDNIKDKHLKMCFDFGHTNCFTYQVKNMNFMKYKDLICCCHIHDNDGRDDEHLIPFYGQIDYLYIIRKLKEMGINIPLTSEARILDPRYPFTEDEFIPKVYQALTKIEEMFGEMNEKC